MSSTFLVIAVGAAVAGFVQGLSGFAFGLVAMSFWAWALEPRLAAVLVVCGSLAGQVLAATTLRRRFDWRLLLPFVLGGLPGIPLGVWLLPRLDIVAFKVVLGALLLVWCPAMLFSGKLPRVRHGGRAADAAAGAVGGVMGGLGGFTGVIPTLWCTLRGFEKDAQRGVIQNFNLSMLAVTFAAYLSTGVIERAMLPAIAVAVPAMLLPAWIGARVYTGLSEARFRQVVLGLLTASGAAMLISALPRLFA